MPRFFFDLLDHETLIDEDGSYLADMDVVRSQATTLAGTHMKDHPSFIRSDHPLRVQVRDDQNRFVFVIDVVASDGAPTTPFVSG